MSKVYYVEQRNSFWVVRHIQYTTYFEPFCLKEHAYLYAGLLEDRYGGTIRSPRYLCACNDKITLFREWVRIVREEGKSA